MMMYTNWGVTKYTQVCRKEPNNVLECPKETTKELQLIIYSIIINI